MATFNGIEQAYPGAAFAVSFCEQCMSDGQFDIIRKAMQEKNHSLVTIARTLQHYTKNTRTELGYETDDPIFAETIAQMDHPEFHTYLRAKLGML